MWVVYLITRDDGKRYVGKTARDTINKRMCGHRHTARFRGRDFALRILYETGDHDDVLAKEAEFVRALDTYHNGLNGSVNGAGNHLSPKFTTLGWTPSEETRQRMRDNHWSKQGYRSPSLGRQWSAEQRKRMSDKRKGRVHTTRFNESDIERLMTEYVRVPRSDTEVGRNGRPLTHVRKFCKDNAEKYGMTSAAMHNILTGKTLAWKPLYERIIDTKS